MLEIQTILHPTDGSKAARDALELAHGLARTHHAKLVLMTAPMFAPPAAQTFAPDYELKQLVEVAEQRLRELAGRFTDVPTETRVVSGDPGWAIVAAAKDCNADLIVMGTHGRTGVGRALMGSVAEHVLRHANCPVLTVRPGAKSD